MVITGGSQGTGLALARLLLKEENAIVTLMARNRNNLKEAVTKLIEELGDAKTYNGIKRVDMISVDLSDADATANAFNEAVKMTGLPLQACFCCAGAARPTLFTEQRRDRLSFEMQADFMTAANTAHVYLHHQLF